MNKLLIAAISGGIDSLVAAYLYKNLGYTIIGVTFKNGYENDKKFEHNIKILIKKIDIKHVFLDVESVFKNKILNYYFSEYLEGRTPNPCVICNARIKFGVLLKYAKTLGANGVITGHYANVYREKNGKFIIKQSVDKDKDQTYFLSMLSQEQLKYSFMPLGTFKKRQVREIAVNLGIPNEICNKESQDLCFIRDKKDFISIATKLYPNLNYKLFKGDIINNNKIVGEHNGIYKFTIGQRSGLNVSCGVPMYVSKINNNNNNIIINTNLDNSLYCNQFVAVDMNWIRFSYKRLKCLVQIKYRQQPKLAIVYKINDRTALIKLSTSLKFITPGQNIAIYKNNFLIAGGIIR